MTTPDDAKERFQRAQHLFDRAWSLSPDQREAFVREQAGDDAALAEEVERLLARAGEAPAVEPGDDDDEGAGRRIGPYRILSTLGEGGMGTVYLAEQRQPLRRRVALKVLKQGMDSRAFLTRFAAERQALAMMEHSCIARVYDAGLAESGQPYLAMEYVKGVAITDYCDQNKLSIDERLDLFVAVCSAVQHAHTKGVMHRDLKPSNILVTEQDGKPEPKIIDFGLAKAADHRLVEATVFTETGQVIGTPEYMSPEQAGVGGLDIDTRTDVFSLGVLLYQLLTGTLPVTREELLRHGYYEMQRLIKEEQMLKPSTKVTTLGDGATAFAKARRLPLGELKRQLRGDLDWIVMKAIEKDRNRRYTTAHELAADLLRHLRDEPVSAGPPSAGYVLSKLAKRYRGALTAAVAVMVALGVGLGLALWQWRVAVEQTGIAEGNARKEKAAKEEADRERDRAKELFARYRKLEDKARLRQFIQRSDGLWPEGPGAVAKMSAWVGEVRGWIEGMADHRSDLAELRTGGTLRGEVWTFADGPEQFLHDALAELVLDLDEFRQPSGLLARVEGSLDWSRRVEKDTIHDHEQAWREANGRLRVHPDFGGLILAPQPGLVPLGRDPDSQLEEFWFHRSGDTPVRGSDGRLRIDAANGIVLVLLPGCTVSIGSDRGPGIYPPETPRHDVELEPFFVAKYELTQGQWTRLAGYNPSTYQSARSLWHPVETVSWREATGVLGRYGLELPTEAQWEYACRAHTPTLWWFGDDRESLVRDGRGRLNAASANIPDAALWPEFDDGHAVHTGTGNFEPNTFGLFDMHGNIAELCRGSAVVRAGSLVDYSRVRHAPGDGLILGPETPHTVIRGGSFWKRVEDAQSGRRIPIDKDAKFDSIGLRVARRIQ